LRKEEDDGRSGGKEDAMVEAGASTSHRLKLGHPIASMNLAVHPPI
jgi:hypothetical protein